jgi:hypothetical protein
VGVKERGITGDEFQTAISQIPELSDSDVSAALEEAEKQLSPRRRKELRACLNKAFSHYVQDRLDGLCLAGAKPSARAKRLERIADSFKQLVMAIGERGNPVDESAWLEIYDVARRKEAHNPPRRTASDYKKTLTELRNQAGQMTDEIKPAFQGNVMLPAFQDLLEQIKGTAVLWRDIVQDALKRERKLIKLKAKEMARHQGNWAMPQLFDTLDRLWREFFHEKPKFRVDRSKNLVRGSCLEFVFYILRCYAQHVPDGLEKLHPGLKARLRRLTPEAIYARFRAVYKQERDEGVDKLERELIEVEGKEQGPPHK